MAQKSRSTYELALSAATARSDRERAWRLVELAEELRREGSLDEALDLLDRAVELNAGAPAEMAAYTCAVAIHCDRGELETARLVGEEARSRAHDPGSLRAVGRMYERLARETGDAALLADAEQCFSLAGLWDQVG